jgi:hypothetical protein
LIAVVHQPDETGQTQNSVCFSQKRGANRAANSKGSPRRPQNKKAESRNAEEARTR